MRLYKQILTKNNCYKAGQKMTVKGFMLHSTGAPNPTLRRYVQPDDGILGPNIGNTHWNQPIPEGNGVCVHAFIGLDKNGEVATYQTLPWDMRGWHAGGAANDGYISCEICEDNLVDPVYFSKVYKEACELIAYICKKFNLDPTKKGVVICHSEGHAMGIASNHADVMHWFPKHRKSMANLRSDVAKLMSKDITNKAKPAQQKTEPSKGKVSYSVRVSRTDLNIRKGPGTDTKVCGIIPKGVYTIVEESSGPGATRWGRLKSGAGWISLDFVTKL